MKFQVEKNTEIFEEFPKSEVFEFDTEAEAVVKLKELVDGMNNEYDGDCYDGYIPGKRYYQWGEDVPEVEVVLLCVEEL